jgi:hypothetical protein
MIPLHTETFSGNSICALEGGANSDRKYDTNSTFRSRKLMSYCKNEGVLTHNISRDKRMCDTQYVDTIFSTEESKYLDEIGKCKDCFNHVLNKLSEKRQKSLMKLNNKRELSMKRIRSISNKMGRDIFHSTQSKKSRFIIARTGTSVPKKITKIKTYAFNSKSPKLRQK